MNSQSGQKLVGPDEPSPTCITNPHQASPFLLLGDHAGNRVPNAIATSGWDVVDMHRHIAWDIGIAGLGARLSAELGATFVSQVYSRLVIDCNRDPAAPDAMPAISDGTPIPANVALSPQDRAARVAAIHQPYHAAIAAELDRRDTAGQATILVSLHSFTPAMQGVARPWQIGVLHAGGDPAFALAVLRLLRQRPGLTVGDNEPYAMDGIDYTVPRHAFAARRPYVEIEIRQDLLATSDQQAEWSALLAPLLTAAAHAG